MIHRKKYSRFTVGSQTNGDKLLLQQLIYMSIIALYIFLRFGIRCNMVLC